MLLKVNFTNNPKHYRVQITIAKEIKPYEEWEKWKHIIVVDKNKKE
jgi:hypothetical protein